MVVLAQTHALLRTLLLGGVVVLAGWWTFFLRGKLGEHERALEERQERIAELAGELEVRDQRIQDLDRSLADSRKEAERLGFELVEKEKEILALEAARRLLKVDHRLARIQVLEQAPLPDDPSRTRTTLRFTELGAEGEPLEEGRVLSVDGKQVYVETLVIKFTDDYVEQGDALRGTSICLFKRLFGEDQKPSEGAALDAAGAQPLRYAGDAIEDGLHRELWSRFWDYANDPELARHLGVRALHGEAPFIEVRPGRSYRVELRSSGGLTLQAE